MSSKKTPPQIIIDHSAPKRDGFSIAGFRAAMKQAENPTQPNRTSLLDYYNDIMIDPHLYSVVEKRLDKITATPFRYVLPSGKNNEKIDLLLKGERFRKMVADVLSSRFWGPSALWVDLSGAEFVDYYLIDRNHYLPQSGVVTKKVTDRTGTDINAGRYPLYTMQVGDKNDLGGLLRAIPWVLFKRGDVSDWATFIELYAFPFRLAKYPAYDDVAKDALKNACAQASSNGFAVIPETTDLSFISGGSSSSADSFEKFASFCDKQVSKCYLHNTLTTDAEGGAYKGEVHQDSEAGVFASDRQFVLDVLNGQFKTLLEAHGFNPADGEFTVEDIDLTPLKDRIAIDKELAGLIEMPPEYFYRRYGIPVPEGGARLVAKNPTASQLVALNARIEELEGEIDDAPLNQPGKSHIFFG